MGWRHRRMRVLDFMRDADVIGYLLIACVGLALLQAIFAPSMLSVIILVALVIVVFSANTNY